MAIQGISFLVRMFHEIIFHPLIFSVLCVTLYCVTISWLHKLCYNAVIFAVMYHPMTIIVNSKCLFLVGYNRVVMNCVRFKCLWRKFVELRGQYELCTWNFKRNWQHTSEGLRVHSIDC